MNSSRTPPHEVAPPLVPMDRRRAARWLAGAALLLAFLSFSGTLQFDFAYDDALQIRDNPIIREWSNAPSFFRHNVWYPVAPDEWGLYYRPGFISWLLVNYKIGDGNPHYWHFSTVLVHVFVVWLVFLLGMRLLGDELAAAIAALIFAVHPVHIESVAWVSGVTDPLLAVFVLGSLYFWVGWRKFGKRRDLIFSLLLYAGATTMKETAVVLPMLTFAYDLIYTERAVRWTRKLRSAVLAVLPFALVTAAYMAARLSILHNFFSSRPPISLAATLLTMPWLLLLYCRHVAFPYGMSLFYDFGPVERLSDPRLWYGIFGLLAVFALVFWIGRRWRDPVIAYSVAVFVLVLAPALYGVRYLDPGELIHDRYLYIPSVGFAWLAGFLFSRWYAADVRKGRSLTAVVLALLAVVGAYGIGTAVQEIHWANNLLLFYRAYQAAPSNLMARNGLASALADRHETGQAMVLYRETIAMDPDFWRTNINFGIFLLNIGENEEAIHYLTRARELGGHAGNYDFFIGVARLHQGRPQEAERLLRSSLRISPNRAEVHRVLAQALVMQQRLPEAIAELQEAVRLNPAQQYIDELHRVQAMQAGAGVPAPSR